MRDRTLFILNCLLMVEHSIIMLMLGPMIPEIMKTFGIREATAGLLLGAGSLGSVIGPLTGGLAIDKAGMKIVITTALAAEIVLLILFGINPFFWAAALLNFLLILSAGAVETSANIIPAMIRSANPGKIMNLVHLTFSVGAFIMPLLIGAYLSGGGRWQNIYLAAAVPAGLLSVVFALSSFPSGKPAAGSIESSGSRQSQDGNRATTSSGLIKLMKNRTLILGMLTLFLYVGGELGFSVWIVYYLESGLGFSKMHASTGMSLFWAGIMAGRLLNSLLSGRLSGMQLIGFSSLLAAAAGVPFLLTSSAVLIYITVFIIGLGMAGGYPNTMVEINRRFPNDMGSATGALALGAGVGAMLFQWLMGVSAELIGIKRAMIIPLVLILLMVPAFRAAAGKSKSAVRNPGN